MSLREIDAMVSERIRTGASLYQVDEHLLRELEPNLILTQNLCQVCAPSGNEVSQVLKALPREPQILWLTPQSISGIFQNLRDLGAAVGQSNVAEKLITDRYARLEELRAKTTLLQNRPRVFCM